MPRRPLDYFTPARARPSRPNPPGPFSSFGGLAALICSGAFLLFLLLRALLNWPAEGAPGLSGAAPVGERLAAAFFTPDPTLIFPPGGILLGLWGMARQPGHRGIALAGVGLNALILLVWLGHRLR